MTLHKSTLLGQVNRLRVFGEVKHRMIVDGACPTAKEVAEALDLTQATVGAHMAALRHAVGLPLPIPSGFARIVNSSRTNPDRALNASLGRANYRWSIGQSADTNLIELPELLRSNLA